MKEVKQNNNVQIIKFDLLESPHEGWTPCDNQVTYKFYRYYIQCTKHVMDFK